MNNESKKLKVGIVGLGMGRFHLDGYRSHPAAEVVGLVDTNPERLAQVGKEQAITGLYASLTEMLAAQELDIVSIATPNKFHHPLTLEALAAGCHVLCEKPMAMNAAEAREMQEAARLANRRLMINFSYRFNDQSYALKKQVEAGALGDVYFGRTVWHRRRGIPGFGGWFGTKALSGGGPLIDLGVHRLDLALWLMGYPRPAWVLGSTYSPIATDLAKREGKTFDVEDLAAAVVKFENGATLIVEASWACNQCENERMETALYGTKGGLRQSNEGNGGNFIAELSEERDGCQFNVRLQPPVPAAKGAMFHFVDAILNNTSHIATGEEGAIVMEILDAIYESARTGAPVKIG